MDAMTELMVEAAKAKGAIDPIGLVVKAQRMARQCIGHEKSVRVDKNTVYNGTISSCTLVGFRRTSLYVIAQFEIRMAGPNGKDCGRTFRIEKC